MRVDEGRKCCTLLAIKTKARVVAGKVERSLVNDPGSELRLGKENKKEKCENDRWDEERRKWSRGVEGMRVG